MAKKFLAVMAACMVLLLAVPGTVFAGEVSDNGASDIMDQVKQKLSAVFEEVDAETANEVFSFLKEQVKEGNLSSGEGLQNAIEAGESRFGVTISKEDVGELVAAMEKLEDLGFSAEYIIDKTQGLYQEYGTDFVDHVDEVVSGAVKNAASNAVSSFFTNLKNSVKNFFSNIFS